MGGDQGRVEKESTACTPSPSLTESLLFATLCLVGLPVDVHVKDGSVYSGVFHTASVEKGYGEWSILTFSWVLYLGLVLGFCWIWRNWFKVLIVMVLVWIEPEQFGLRSESFFEDLFDFWEKDNTLWFQLLFFKWDLC